MHSITYNPWLCGVGTRTTRSPLTASERSTAIGITTGMIGTTDDKRRNANFVRASAHFKTFHSFLNYGLFFLSHIIDGGNNATVVNLSDLLVCTYTSI